MQEEVTNKTVALIVDGAKLTEQTFEKAVKKFLEETQKSKQPKIYRDKQTHKQLAGQNAGLANIEISELPSQNQVNSVMVRLRILKTEANFTASFYICFPPAAECPPGAVPNKHVYWRSRISGLSKGLRFRSVQLQFVGRATFGNWRRPALPCQIYAADSEQKTIAAGNPPR